MQVCVRVCTSTWGGQEGKGGCTRMCKPMWRHMWVCPQVWGCIEACVYTRVVASAGMCAQGACGCVYWGRYGWMGVYVCAHGWGCM